MFLTTWLLLRFFGFRCGSLKSDPSQDVYHEWRQIMSLNYMPLEDTPLVERNRFRKISFIVAVIKFIDAVRVGVTYFIFDDTGIEHWFGHTMDPIGKTAKTLGGACTFICLQMGLFRLITTRFDGRNDMMFASVLKSMVRRGESKMLKLLLRGIKMSITNVMIVASLFYLRCMLINLSNSGSRTETMIWIFWFIIDIYQVFRTPSDAVIFPIMWILVVRELRREGNELAKSLATEPDFKKLFRNYIILKLKAQRVNKMSKEILFAIAFSNTPMICMIVYCVTHIESVYFKVSLAMTGLGVAIIASIVLVFAAGMTTTSRMVHQRLCSLQANAGSSARLNGQQKKLLLSIIEEIGSETPSLAIYTVSGEKYTSLSMLHHFLETVITYTLLVTFESKFTAN